MLSPRGLGLWCVCCLLGLRELCGGEPGGPPLPVPSTSVGRRVLTPRSSAVSAAQLMAELPPMTREAR